MYNILNFPGENMYKICINMYMDFEINFLE